MNGKKTDHIVANSLSDIYPDIAKYWHPTKNGTLAPESVSPGSNKKVWWTCSEGHIYDRDIYHQVQSAASCPVCTGRRLVQGINDIKTKYPDIASEWDEEANGSKKPEDYTFASSAKVCWKCKTCGYAWSAIIKRRCIRGNGCNRCARKKTWEKRFEAMELGLTDPALLEEWDYERNKKGPECYSEKSNAKVYWHCKKCSYSWEARIANRTILGRGCPCCANMVVVKGVNDLATTHPEIAKEWYQPKNGDITPFDVTHGSRKKYYWLCPRGHVYPASLLHRTSGAGTNCPICNSGRHTSFAEQAVYFYVKKAFPNAMNGYKDIFDKGMEIDIYLPSEKIGIEYDGVYWHHRKTSTFEREQRKYEVCKKHGIKLLRIRENSTDESPVADTSILMSSDGTDEDMLSTVIEKVFLWLSSNGADRRIPDIDISRDRFDILSYLKGPVKNSVQEVSPELANEWDYGKNGNLKPDMIAAGSSQTVNWICSKCGYRWATRIYQRTKIHTGCPKCAGQVFEKGINDLETKNPELLVDWDYEKNMAENIIPCEIQYNSGKRVNWKCHKCGYRWEAPLNKRTVQGNGCIKCGYEAGKKLKHKMILEKQGCISDPLLLSEWDFDKNNEIGLSPYELTPGSTKYAFWICSKCGHKWKAPIARRSNGAGCRKCADRAIPDLKRKTLIKQGKGLSDELLLKEWDYEKNPKEPTEYSYGSKEKVYWVCSVCGYKWSAAINSRHKGAGCPACAGNVAVPGRNDLATKKPELAKEWDYDKNIGIIPDQVTYSSGKKYWWICPKGHESYYATPSHRVNGTGCPQCAKLIISKKSSKAIDQLSIDGKVIRTYNSAKEAAEELNINRSAISNAIRKQKTSGGYRWRYHEVNGQ